jgi:hypothetical protein
MLPKESTTHPKKEMSRGIAIIGTGLSSTLLSSQRTTAHHQTEPHSAARPPGHSLYFTRRFRRVKSAFRNRIQQPQKLLEPAEQYTMPRGTRSSGFGRTAAACLCCLTRLPRPFPCRLGEHYPVVPAAPNRPPHPIALLVRLMPPSQMRSMTIRSGPDTE